MSQSAYYPFGMELEGLSKQTSPLYSYLYNGKELDSDFGLGWYHYGARMYDATRGQFTSVDPIADQFTWVSPFNYAENEPIANIDLHGLQKQSSTKDRGKVETNLAWERPFQATRINQIRKRSNDIKQLIVRGANNNHANALFHAIGQAKATVELGSQVAKDWGDAHESEDDVKGSGNSNLLTRTYTENSKGEIGSADDIVRSEGCADVSLDKKGADAFVDLLNNITGRAIGENATFSGVTDERQLVLNTLDAMKNGQLFEAKANNKGGFTIQKISISDQTYEQYRTRWLNYIDNNKIKEN